MRIINVEQGSNEWHKERAGRITGTSLKYAIGSAKVQETLMNELIAEKMTEIQPVDLNSEAVQRGRDLEPVALKAVRERTDIDFVTTGMIAPDNIDEYAISPDAIHYDDGVVIGGLEIKCPNSKKHVEYIRGGVVPKEYKWQVLAPFLVDESVQWWDFASFDDRNYEIPLFIVRTYRKDILKDIVDASVNLNDFIDRFNQEYLKLTF